MSKQTPELQWRAARPLVEAAFNANLSTLIEGAPGTGKTSLPLAIAKDRGWRTFTLNASLAEPSDILGLPVNTGHGEAKWLPIGLLAEVLKCDEEAVLILDDVGHSRSDVQAALWPIVAERRIGTRPLPSGVRIVLTANRTVDVGAGARALLTPLASRAALRFTLVPDQGATLDYIRTRHAESEWVSSILNDAMTINSSMFNRASPREWELACNWVAAAEKSLLTLDETLVGAWPIGQSMNVAESLKNATFGRAVNQISQLILRELKGEATSEDASMDVQRICSGVDPKTVCLSVARTIVNMDRGDIADEAIADAIRTKVGGVAAIELMAIMQAEKAGASSQKSRREKS